MGLSRNPSTWLMGFTSFNPSYERKKRRAIARRFVFERGECRLLRLLVGIDHRAGLQLGRRQHGLVVHAAPGLEAGALLDVVVLHLQHSGLLPFAGRTELDRAVNGLERI